MLISLIHHAHLTLKAVLDIGVISLTLILAEGSTFPAHPTYSAWSQLLVLVPATHPLCSSTWAWSWTLVLSLIIMAGSVGGLVCTPTLDPAPGHRHCISLGLIPGPR